MRHSILAFLLVLIAGLALLTPGVASAEEQLSPQALDIANSLNCPVCEGLSVRDSNSQLSQQMREEIQRRLDDGQTRQQILDYFVDRYGIGILRDPPKSGFVLTLWWGPVIGLAVGAIVLGTFIAQRRRRVVAKRSGSVAPTPVHSVAGAAPDDDLSQYEERLRRQIDGLDTAN